MSKIPINNKNHRQDKPSHQIKRLHRIQCRHQSSSTKSYLHKAPKKHASPPSNHSSRHSPLASHFQRHVSLQTSSDTLGSRHYRLQARLFSSTSWSPTQNESQARFDPFNVTIRRRTNMLRTKQMSLFLPLRTRQTSLLRTEKLDFDTFFDSLQFTHTTQYDPDVLSLYTAKVPEKRHKHFDTIRLSQFHHIESFFQRFVQARLARFPQYGKSNYPTMLYSPMILLQKQLSMQPMTKPPVLTLDQHSILGDLASITIKNVYLCGEAHIHTRVLDIYDVTQSSSPSSSQSLYFRRGGHTISQQFPHIATQTESDQFIFSLTYNHARHIMGLSHEELAQLSLTPQALTSPSLLSPLPWVSALFDNVYRTYINDTDDFNNSLISDTIQLPHVRLRTLSHEQEDDDNDSNDTEINNMSNDQHNNNNDKTTTINEQNDTHQNIHSNKKSPNNNNNNNNNNNFKEITTPKIRIEVECTSNYTASISSLYHLLQLSPNTVIIRGTYNSHDAVLFYTLNSNTTSNRSISSLAQLDLEGLNSLLLHQAQFQCAIYVSTSELEHFETHQIRHHHDGHHHSSKTNGDDDGAGAVLDNSDVFDISSPSNHHISSSSSSPLSSSRGIAPQSSSSLGRFARFVNIILPALSHDNIAMFSPLLHQKYLLHEETTIVSSQNDQITDQTSGNFDQPNDQHLLIESATRQEQFITRCRLVVDYFCAKFNNQSIYNLYRHLWHPVVTPPASIVSRSNTATAATAARGIDKTSIDTESLDSSLPDQTPPQLAHFTSINPFYRGHVFYNVQHYALDELRKNNEFSTLLEEARQLVPHPALFAPPEEPVILDLEQLPHLFGDGHLSMNYADSPSMLSEYSSRYFTEDAIPMNALQRRVYNQYFRTQVEQMRRAEQKSNKINLRLPIFHCSLPRLNYEQFTPIQQPFSTFAYALCWPSIMDALLPALSPISDDLTSLLHENYTLEPFSRHSQREIEVLQSAEQTESFLFHVSLVKHIEIENNVDISSNSSNISTAQTVDLAGNPIFSGAQITDLSSTTHKVISIGTWICQKHPSSGILLPLYHMENSFRILRSTLPPAFVEEITPETLAKHFEQNANSSLLKDNPDIATETFMPPKHTSFDSDDDIDHPYDQNHVSSPTFDNPNALIQVLPTYSLNETITPYNPYENEHLTARKRYINQLSLLSPTRRYQAIADPTMTPRLTEHTPLLTDQNPIESFRYDPNISLTHINRHSSKHDLSRLSPNEIKDYLHTLRHNAASSSMYNFPSFTFSLPQEDTIGLYGLYSGEFNALYESSSISQLTQAFVRHSPNSSATGGVKRTVMNAPGTSVHNSMWEHSINSHSTDVTQAQNKWDKKNPRRQNRRIRPSYNAMTPISSKREDSLRTESDFVPESGDLASGISAYTYFPSLDILQQLFILNIFHNGLPRQEVIRSSVQNVQPQSLINSAGSGGEVFDNPTRQHKDRQVVNDHVELTRKAIIKYFKYDGLGAFAPIGAHLDEVLVPNLNVLQNITSSLLDSMIAHNNDEDDFFDDAISTTTTTTTTTKQPKIAPLPTTTLSQHKRQQKLHETSLGQIPSHLSIAVPQTIVPPMLLKSIFSSFAYEYVSTNTELITSYIKRSIYEQFQLYIDQQTISSSIAAQAKQQILYGYLQTFNLNRLDERIIHEDIQLLRSVVPGSNFVCDVEDVEPLLTRGGTPNDPFVYAELRIKIYVHSIDMSVTVGSPTPVQTIAPASIFAPSKVIEPLINTANPTLHTQQMRYYFPHNNVTSKLLHVASASYTISYPITPQKHVMQRVLCKRLDHIRSAITQNESQTAQLIQSTHITHDTLQPGAERELFPFQPKSAIIFNGHGGTSNRPNNRRLPITGLWNELYLHPHHLQQLAYDFFLERVEKFKKKASRRSSRNKSSRSQSSSGATSSTNKSSAQQEEEQQESSLVSTSQPTTSNRRLSIRERKKAAAAAKAQEEAAAAAAKKVPATVSDPSSVQLLDIVSVSDLTGQAIPNDEGYVSRHDRKFQRRRHEVQEQIDQTRLSESLAIAELLKPVDPSNLQEELGIISNQSSGTSGNKHGEFNRAIDLIHDELDADILSAIGHQSVDHTAYRQRQVRTVRIADDDDNDNDGDNDDNKLQQFEHENMNPRRHRNRHTFDDDNGDDNNNNNSFSHLDDAEIVIFSDDVIDDADVLSHLSHDVGQSESSHRHYNPRRHNHFENSNMSVGESLENADGSDVPPVDFTSSQSHRRHRRVAREMVEADNLDSIDDIDLDAFFGDTPVTPPSQKRPSVPPSNTDSVNSTPPDHNHDTTHTPSSPNTTAVLVSSDHEQQQSSLDEPDSMNNAPAPVDPNYRPDAKQLQEMIDSYLMSENRLLSNNIYSKTIQSMMTMFHLNFHDIVTTNPSIVPVPLHDERIRFYWIFLLCEAIGIDLPKLQTKQQHVLRKRQEQYGETPPSFLSQLQADISPLLQYSVANSQMKRMLQQCLSSEHQYMFIYGPGSFPIDQDNDINNNNNDDKNQQRRQKYQQQIKKFDYSSTEQEQLTIEYVDRGIGVLALPQFQQINTFIHEIATYVHSCEEMLSKLNMATTSIPAYAQYCQKMQLIDDLPLFHDIKHVAQLEPLHLLFARLHDGKQREPFYNRLYDPLRDIEQNGERFWSNLTDPVQALQAVVEYQQQKALLNENGGDYALMLDHLRLQHEDKSKTSQEQFNANEQHSILSNQTVVNSFPLLTGQLLTKEQQFLTQRQPFSATSRFNYHYRDTTLYAGNSLGELSALAALTMNFNDVIDTPYNVIEAITTTRRAFLPETYDSELVQRQARRARANEQGLHDISSDELENYFDDDDNSSASSGYQTFGGTSNAFDEQAGFIRALRRYYHSSQVLGASFFDPVNVANGMYNEDGGSPLMHTAAIDPDVFTAAAGTTPDHDMGGSSSRHDNSSGSGNASYAAFKPYNVESLMNDPFSTSPHSITWIQQLANADSLQLLHDSLVKDITRTISSSPTSSTGAPSSSGNVPGPNSAISLDQWLSIVWSRGWLQFTHIKYDEENRSHYSSMAFNPTKSRLFDELHQHPFVQQWFVQSPKAEDDIYGQYDAILRRQRILGEVLDQNEEEFYKDVIQQESPSNSTTAAAATKKPSTTSNNQDPTQQQSSTSLSTAHPLQYEQYREHHLDPFAYELEKLAQDISFVIPNILCCELSQLHQFSSNFHDICQSHPILYDLIPFIKHERSQFQSFGETLFRRNVSENSQDGDDDHDHDKSSNDAKQTKQQQNMSPNDLSIDDEDISFMVANVQDYITSGFNNVQMDTNDPFILEFLLELSEANNFAEQYVFSGKRFMLRLFDTVLNAANTIPPSTTLQLHTPATRQLIVDALVNEVRRMLEHGERFDASLSLTSSHVGKLLQHESGTPTHTQLFTRPLFQFDDSGDDQFGLQSNLYNSDEKMTRLDAQSQAIFLPTAFPTLPPSSSYDTLRIAPAPAGKSLLLFDGNAPDELVSRGLVMDSKTALATILPPSTTGGVALSSKRDKKRLAASGIGKNDQLVMFSDDAVDLVSRHVYRKFRDFLLPNSTDILSRRFRWAFSFVEQQHAQLSPHEGSSPVWHNIMARLVSGVSGEHMSYFPQASPTLVGAQADNSSGLTLLNDLLSANCAVHPVWSSAVFSRQMGEQLSRPVRWHSVQRRLMEQNVGFVEFQASNNQNNQHTGHNSTHDATTATTYRGLKVNIVEFGTKPMLTRYNLRYLAQMREKRIVEPNLERSQHVQQELLSRVQNKYGVSKDTLLQADSTETHTQQHPSAVRSLQASVPPALMKSIRFDINAAPIPEVHMTPYYLQHVEHNSFLRQTDVARVHKRKRKKSKKQTSLNTDDDDNDHDDNNSDDSIVEASLVDDDDDNQSRSNENSFDLTSSDLDSPLSLQDGLTDLDDLEYLSRILQMDDLVDEFEKSLLDDLDDSILYAMEPVLQARHWTECTAYGPITPKNHNDDKSGQPAPAPSGGSPSGTSSKSPSSRSNVSSSSLPPPSSLPPRAQQKHIAAAAQSTTPQSQTPPPPPLFPPFARDQHSASAAPKPSHQDPSINANSPRTTTSARNRQAFVAPPRKSNTGTIRRRPQM